MTSDSSRPPNSARGFHTRHVTGPEAELEPGVAAQVLVGEEQHLVAPGLAPVAGPSAHSSTARAFDDVHTEPPWRPTNALSAAEEFM